MPKPITAVVRTLAETIRHKPGVSLALFVCWNDDNTLSYFTVGEDEASISDILLALCDTLDAKEEGKPQRAALIVFDGEISLFGIGDEATKADADITAMILLRASQLLAGSGEGDAQALLKRTLELIDEGRR